MTIRLQNPKGVTVSSIKVFVKEKLFTDYEFDRQFTRNSFGWSCGVWDCLWFERDLKHVPATAGDLFAKNIAMPMLVVWVSAIML